LRTRGRARGAPSVGQHRHAVALLCSRCGGLLPRAPIRHKARRFLLREGAVGGDRSGENRKARVAVELLGKRQERARVLREARATPWEETPRPILGVRETFGTLGRCGKRRTRIDVEQREYLLELVEEADLRSVEE